MRKIFIMIVTLMTFLNIEPALASDEGNHASLTQHEYFDSYLTLTQSKDTSSNSSSGQLDFELTLSNINAKFVPYIGGDVNCAVKFEPEGNTYFQLMYDLTLSEDSKFQDLEKFFGISVTLDFDMNGNLLWISENGNNAISIDDRRNGFNEGYALSRYAKQNSKGVTVRDLSLPIEGGKTYYVREYLMFIQNSACLSGNRSGNFPLGDEINKVTSISVQNTPQEISLSLPKEKVSLAAQAIRIKASATSGLPVEAVETNPKVCIVNGTVVILRGVGLCEIEFSQSGGKGFSPVTRIASFEVANSAKTTIACIKGKVKKNVTGVNPKCPSGYKKK